MARNPQHDISCPQSYDSCDLGPCNCGADQLFGLPATSPTKAPDMAMVVTTDSRGVRHEAGWVERPPLGLRPRSCVGKDESPRYRMREIAGAVQRYADAGKSVPTEWLVELVEVNAVVADLNEGASHVR